MKISVASKLTRRRGRDAARLFLVEGPQAVREALHCGLLVQLFATEEAFSRHSDLVDVADEKGILASHVDDKALRILSDAMTPQGLVGVARFTDVRLPDLSSPRLVAVAHEMQDPGNAGALLRVADATGADAVIFTHGSVDPYNGKCVRSSVGSLFHLPIVRDVSLQQTVDFLHEHNIAVIATAGEAESDLFAVDSSVMRQPTAWIFGNEAQGIDEAAVTLADHVVSIPIYGKAESLNVATAAAVCLYESARVQQGSW